MSTRLFNWILFIIGGLLLVGLYLYFVVNWRPGCAILWFIGPFYIAVGAYILEG